MTFWIFSRDGKRTNKTDMWSENKFKGAWNILDCVKLFFIAKSIFVHIILILESYDNKDPMASAVKRRPI